MYTYSQYSFYLVHSLLLIVLLQLCTYTLQSDANYTKTKVYLFSVVIVLLDTFVRLIIQHHIVLVIHFNESSYFYNYCLLRVIIKCNYVVVHQGTRLIKTICLSNYTLLFVLLCFVNCLSSGTYFV